MYGVGRFVQSFPYLKWSQIGADGKNGFLSKIIKKEGNFLLRRVTDYVLGSNSDSFLEIFK